jgi:uncharacterized protein (DUF58 family)
MINFFRRRRADAIRVSLDRRIRELEMVTSRMIRAGFAGQYHSAFHGRGIEFAQVREYQPGDDIRTIDWNVTARTGVPHVKEFVEERDLTIIIAVDTSASMRFGSLDRRKIELAAELVTILSFAALKNRDRVGLLTFSNAIDAFIPPRSGRTHVQHLARRVLTAAAGTGGAADFELLSRYLGNLFVKRAVLIILSDFLDPGLEQPLRKLSGRHDVIAIELTDPREALFPRRGLVTLVDSESGRRRTVDLRAASVAENRQRIDSGVTEAMRRTGVDHLKLSTAAPYDRPLREFFQRRVARVR